MAGASDRVRFDSNRYTYVSDRRARRDARNVAEDFVMFIFPFDNEPGVKISEVLSRLAYICALQQMLSGIVVDGKTADLKGKGIRITEDRGVIDLLFRSFNGRSRVM